MLTWRSGSGQRRGACCGSSLNLNDRLTICILQDGKPCAARKVLFERIQLLWSSVEIDERMTSHDFLRCEHLIADDEARFEDIEIDTVGKSLVDQVEKMPARICIAKKKGELGRRTGIKIRP